VKVCVCVTTVKGTVVEVTVDVVEAEVVDVDDAVVARVVEAVMLVVSADVIVPTVV